MAQQLPAGMRNNNPGNIKYVGQGDAVGPSKNTDQGDPQAVYASPQAGMRAMYNLLSRKYAGGKVTPMMMIAGQGGWTPGNSQAAMNVAKSMGIGPNDDIQLTNPAMATRFMRALMLQEHGQASMAYSDDMITGAISGQGGGTATAQAPQTATAPQYPNQPPLSQPTSTVANPWPATTQKELFGPQQPPSPYGPQFGPQMNPADQMAGWQKEQDRKTAKNEAIDDLASGLAGAGGGKSAWPARPQYAQPKAARIDDPEIASVAAPPDQRDQLSMLMAKLNSGKLWM